MFNSPFFKGLLSNLAAALVVGLVGTVGNNITPSGGAAAWASSHPLLAAPLYIFANSVWHNYLTKWGFVPSPMVGGSGDPLPPR